jgi:hypothetical protein
MEGGFNTNSKQEWEETSRIVVWPSMDVVELTNPDLPLQASSPTVQESVRDDV